MNNKFFNSKIILIVIAQITFFPLILSFCNFRAVQLNDGPSVLAGTITVAGYTYHNSEVEINGIEYKDFKLYKNGVGETTQNLDSLTMQ
jgi:hypothetical protein